MSAQHDLDALFKSAPMHEVDFAGVNTVEDTGGGPRKFVVLFKCSDCGEAASFIMDRDCASAVAVSILNFLKERQIH